MFTLYELLLLAYPVVFSPNKDLSCGCKVEKKLIKLCEQCAYSIRTASANSVESNISCT